MSSFNPAVPAVGEDDFVTLRALVGYNMKHLAKAHRYEFDWEEKIWVRVIPRTMLALHLKQIPFYVLDLKTNKRYKPAYFGGQY